MTRLLNAAMLALTMGSAAAAQTGQPMKYPNSYAAWKSHLDCIGEDYFECDDTSKTCLRGKTNVGGGFVFVGEQLAEDRSTVIAHVMGQGSYWLNFDSGDRPKSDYCRLVFMPTINRRNSATTRTTASWWNSTYTDMIQRIEY
jgi:hypothetical protein